MFLTQVHRGDKRSKEFSCLDSSPVKLFQLLKPWGKGFVRTHHRHQPCFPGLPQSRRHSNSALLIPGVLATNCCEAAVGSQVSPWCTIQSGSSCRRSLRFLGSLSFVYFLMFNICFVPLVTLLGVSLSHVLHLSQTWAVSSVGWENAFLVSSSGGGSPRLLSSPKSEVHSVFPQRSVSWKNTHSYLSPLKIQTQVEQEDWMYFKLTECVGQGWQSFCCF